MNKKTQKSSLGKKVAIGTSLVAAGTAAYLFFGPEGKKNRKTAKVWSDKMQKEIAEKVEKVKDVSEPTYKKIVAEVKEKYSALQNVDQKELSSLTTKLSKQWKSIQKIMGQSKTKIAKKAKK